ncbi:peptidoglycan recognition protein family protein [Streptomyces hoynatensis]|uniref:N-acetylmuramoyl-L-alanine amidase n=1 Tax=Streptomyces hoynatensis TaxID=1141874 RepID=A0A3A9YM58_9ACTN|nr:peptidoglycan recognition protein [Streptomyces hoynatensis]RKN37405.1 N-acetylmuramoyl-L-alanine amidase [Streptomyces hoynatensis]
MRALRAPAAGAATSFALLLLTLPAALPARAEAHPPPAAAQPGAARPAGAVDRGRQSLPLRPLGRVTGAAGRSGGAPAGAQGLPATGTGRFSLLGVVWDDANAELTGRIQVRTRAADSGRWSPWTTLRAGDAHSPDPGSAESAGRRLRGGTAPLWVGPSDGVQVRAVPGTGRDAPPPAVPAAAPGAPAAAPAARAPRAAALPEGLRLELVAAEPAARELPAPGAGSGQAPARPPAGGAAANGPAGAVTAATGAGAGAGDAAGAGVEDGAPPARVLPGLPHGAPRPGIVSRADWGADEDLREEDFVYTGDVRTVFVHHTAGTNAYSCAESPALIRAIYRYHVESQGWRDIGYNFLVDRCGTVYEGRAGGVDRPVQGAHTLGFNQNSAGVAVLGTYTDTEPGAAVLTALARLAGWKLGLSGVDPRERATLVSGGGTYPKGTEVVLANVSGHRDGYDTDCPGDRLYAQLPEVREQAAAFQGR